MSIGLSSLPLVFVLKFALGESLRRLAKNIHVFSKPAAVATHKRMKAQSELFTPSKLTLLSFGE